MPAPSSFNFIPPPTAGSTGTRMVVYRCLARLSPSPLPSPVHRGDIMTFGWWASRGKRTHTQRSPYKGAQEERGGGQRRKEALVRNDTAAKPVPRSTGPPAASRAAPRACQQPPGPSSRAPSGRRRPRRVTAALSGASGSWPRPDDPPPAAAHRPSCPGAGRRSPTARPPHGPGAAPAAQPGSPGLTLTRAGGAAASFSRRAPGAPSSRGGGGASETQTRVCSKSRAQRHSTAASHNTPGAPPLRRSAPPAPASPRLRRRP